MDNKYKKLGIFFFIIFVIIISTLFVICITNKIKNKDDYILQSNNKYKGLCIFDIDGTLTTGKNNFNVVQKCLDNGYAVGVNTAGFMYHPDNIHMFKWMPLNLYNFMYKRKFNTFNNVIRGIVTGAHKPEQYKKIRDQFITLNIGELFGWLKGFALDETAKLYGVKPENVYMFDDSRSFIKGIKKYNNKFNVICAGADCGGSLDVDTFELPT